MTHVPMVLKLIARSVDGSRLAERYVFAVALMLPHVGMRYKTHIEGFNDIAVFTCKTVEPWLDKTQVDATLEWLADEGPEFSAFLRAHTPDALMDRIVRQLVQTRRYHLCNASGVVLDSCTRALQGAGSTIRTA